MRCRLTTCTADRPRCRPACADRGRLRSSWICCRCRTRHRSRPRRPLLVAVFYFWTVHRPDLLPPLALFVLGVPARRRRRACPLGVTSLALLLARALLLSGQRWLARQQPWPVVWACFLPAAVMVGRPALAGLVSLTLGRAFPCRRSLLEAAPDVRGLPGGRRPAGRWCNAGFDGAGPCSSLRLSAPAASRAAPWSWAARSWRSSGRWRPGSTISRSSAAPTSRCWPRTTAPTSGCWSRRAARSSTASAGRWRATSRPTASR